MKLLFSAVCILIFFNKLVAQKLDEPNRLMLLSKYEDAKKEIDKIFAEPGVGEDPGALLLKTKIYAEVFFDSLLRIKYPASGDDSYNAFKQYVFREPSLKSFRETNGMRPVSILYFVRFNEGRKFFTESKWNEALKNFIVAEEIGDFISKNGLGRSKQNIDTFTVLYAGYAAQNAQNISRALYYYKKFATEKIGGQDFIGIYRYLLDVSIAEKKADDFIKYITLAKSLYPNEQQLWKAYETGYADKNGSVLK